MSKNNLEIWKDRSGVIHISFWDVMNGKDSHLEIFPQGQIYQDNTPVRDLDYKLFDSLLAHIEESYKS